MSDSHAGFEGRDRPAYWSRPKLTPAQMDEVRQRYDDGESAASIAAEFGVRARLIYELCGRRKQ